MIPQFAKENSHFRNLEAHSSTRHNGIKYSLLLPIFYFIFWGVALFTSHTLVFILLYGIMGWLTVFIFLFIIHEAVHGSYFKKQKANQNILYLFDVLGANSFIFAKRHLIAHHNFCNIESWDADIEQSGPIKIYPFQKSNPFQKYQHYFIFFLYPLYALNWLMLRDFKDFFYSKSIIKKYPIKISTIDYVRLFLGKGLFIGYLIILPIFMGKPWPIVVFAFLFYTMCTSILALFILLPPHVLEEERLIPNPKIPLDHSWAEHQFKTTANIKLPYQWCDALFANFNFHLTHHIFPSMPWYALKEKNHQLSKYCQENNINMAKFPITTALKMHFQLIKRNANNLDFFDESM